MNWNDQVQSEPTLEHVHKRMLMSRTCSYQGIVFTYIISRNIYKTLGDDCLQATEQETEARKARQIANGHTPGTRSG